MARIRIDDRAKSVEVEQLQCERNDHWDHGSAEEGIDEGVDGLRCGVGGIGWYRKNLENMKTCGTLSGEYFGRKMTFEAFAAKFFAPDWTVLQLPRFFTRPKIQQEFVALAKTCDAAMRCYYYGPWGRTVGTYFVHRNAAATTIQKHFRGWRVRMATAFNPTTPIGAYFALRDFRALNELKDY